MRTASLSLTLLLAASTASAQYRGISASYGSWWRGGDATIYSVTLNRPLFGALGYGLTFNYIHDGAVSAPGTDRTSTGGELNVNIRRNGSGLYGIIGGGVGMLNHGGSLDAHWSAGLGYDFRLFGNLSAGLQARYRVEDRAIRGFWDLEPGYRGGFSVQATIGLGPRPARTAVRGNSAPPSSEIPSRSEIRNAARSRGASSDAAAKAADVVQTAIDVMGTPYQWGGTDDNGFDCSGLIQYAYKEHGIILPRVSRDQARAGESVRVTVGELRPGDILGFAVETGGRVTHVGLYVGEGRFIHSASGGVQISSLVETDGESSWWSRRLVAARRILQ